MMMFTSVGKNVTSPTITVTAPRLRPNTSVIRGVIAISGTERRTIATGSHRASIGWPALLAFARRDGDVDLVSQADEPHADAHDDTEDGEHGVGAAAPLRDDEHAGTEQ